MTKPTFTPGPWEYVPSTEYHGPYVTDESGRTICDFYVMSNPSATPVWEGGLNRPVPFLGEEADHNARLTGTAPKMLAMLKDILDFLKRSGYDTRLVKEVIKEAEGES